MNRSSSPRRATAVAVAAALAATLAFGGLAAAKDHPGKGQSHGGGKQQTQQVQGGTVQASLKVKGNASHPGGVFRVLAVLKSARADRPPTMDAVVHFATGDLDVELTRSGGGAAYHAFVPVPDDEPEGVVMIDATAVVAGKTLEATGAGKILDRGDSTESATTQETETESPSESPAACEPESSPSSDEATEEPSEEASDDPSESPDESAEESPEESPDESPEESADADESADDCTTTQVQLTDEIIAAVLEYLETLFA
jgi:hypothetical protein